MPAATPSIVFVYRNPFSFVEIDRELLAERWTVQSIRASGVASLVRLVPAILRGELLFGWSAGWHTLWPFTLAWLLRKPSLLVVGGYDTASVPEIGYGYQRGGLQRAASRWVIRRAARVMTNSRYSRREIEANIGLDPRQVAVVHHGVPDGFGDLRDELREPLVLSVGTVSRLNYERKGHRAFVEAAARLPDVPFVLAGRWHDDAIEDLRGRASANVEFTGWLAQNELNDLFRRAAVYVQASRHEGFGVAVAEAMLAGCIPVVTTAGALPEVVGDVGVQVPVDRSDELAEGIRTALGMGREEGWRARSRALECFPVERRRERLWALVEELLGR